MSLEQPTSVTRFVTSHNADARARFTSIEQSVHHTKPADTAAAGPPPNYSNLWVTDTPFPALNDERDLSKGHHETHLLVSEGASFR